MNAMRDRLGLTTLFATAVLVAVCWSFSAMAASEGQAPKPAFTMIVENGLIDAQIVNQPLPKVLEELSRKLALKVYYREAVADRRVSATLKNATMAKALNEILEGISFALVKGKPGAEQKGSATDRAYELWVLAGSGTFRSVELDAREAPPGAATQEQQVAGWSVDELVEFGAALKESSLEEKLSAARNDADPDVRAMAIAQLGMSEETGPEVTAALVAALEDNVSAVRQVALRNLEKVGDVPFKPVAHVALRDASPRLRRQAMDMLMSHHPEAAMGVFSKAAADDPELGEHAEVMQRILREAEALRKTSAQAQR